MGCARQVSSFIPAALLLLVERNSRQAKVAQLDVTLVVDKNVVWLEITVYDPVLMQVSAVTMVRTRKARE
jgi:hypothetical protein